ncbi:2-phospho-L-lactate guanylyltransferase [Solihabitans fulvus]|uniref:Phosphoenolpyruvate guanylyltransferase n=1 Tax=Solihabitans fulvus TaxID=1892852 RepID=A0A5B2WSK0_9PSEU|nr:2-phospho-L-lactate guanylyltransferase [Solihabitans fulvus]KAA2253536.1 2-phospho-L-lactate guanylyltransferase [Solihabitans fulvus]
MRTKVDLVIPVKALGRAKSRLVGAADGGAGDPDAHAALALALALDTATAAHAADVVRRVVTVTSDPAVAAELRAVGVEVLSEERPESGLNTALRLGAALLRGRDPRSVVGALQADLPALRPEELAAAVRASAGRRAFCPDRQGTGTTLLLSAPGGDLGPRFGVGSAGAHRDSGAVALLGPWPSLRCDVDTEEDLVLAGELGLGSHTAARLCPL